MKNKKIMLGPVITIIFMTFLIIFISAVGSIFNLSGEVTKVVNGTLQTESIAIKSLFSLEGFKYIFSSPVETFKTFQPLILLIMSLMAVSIGKSSGFLKATFIKYRKLKPAVVTFITLFIGIISSFFGEYAYIVLLPLTAVIYQYLGRNSILGILTMFIGITLGYGSGLVFNYDDYQLGILTREAVRITVDENYVFNAWSNSFIMGASAVILTIVGTLIIESFLRPRIKGSIYEEDELIISKKALVISNITFLLLVLVFVYMIIPGLPYSGLLLDMKQSDYVAQLLGGTAPFSDAFMFMLLIIMMVCSGIYGKISRNIKNTNEFSVGLSHEFDSLGYLFVLMFFISLMIGILDWTNLGDVLAAWLVNLVSGMEFTGIPLIIMMFILVILISFLIPDAVTKWQIGSPILVPLFMKANITPDFTQFVFKAADSVGKGLTPFFIYFIVMLAFLEKYNDKETNKITVFGTLKLLMPTILLFAVTWILILIGWFIIGIPIGPNTNPTM
ncbi:MAG: AbgT family transporter [Bacilli bacterium]|nr:AbgT family transporter [Bacilli bacterium]